MTYAHPGFQPSSIARLRSWVEGRLRAIRPLLNPIALAEGWRESLEGYPADPEHEPHLVAAIAWLARAQDATPDGGISRAFTLAWHPHFGRRGWQPPYPETTGYIIPTFYAAARRLGCPGLSVRAERAARWEIDIQLPTGAARGGVLGEPESPAVFNTGQVLLGLLAAFEKTAQGSFADAARRAARYLVAMLEGGRVLNDARLVHAAERAARPLVAAVRGDGWMPGRYRSDWSAAVRWSCLTGQAQMANNWIRLAEITGDPQWVEPVPAVLGFLKRTQNRHSAEPGVRGGIKGAWPVGGDYGAYEVLNWATKFFADALMRHEAIQTNGLTAAATVPVLA